MTLVDELHALRGAAAVCPHDLRTLIRVSGADHREWLNRLASNPVIDEPPGRCILATLMDGKGKMRADVRMLTRDDDVLLDVPRSHVDGLMRVLDMFIIKEDVALEDLSGTTRAVSIVGPGAGDVVGAMDGWSTPGDGEALYGVDGVTALVPSVIAGLDGVDAFVATDACDAVVAAATAAGANPVSLEALDVARIERGVPWFASELADAVIPLEACLDDWVSITKGCYPGQEVVARITNLGQVARKLVRLEAPGGAHAASLAAGAQLLGTGERDGKKAGAITSVLADPDGDVTRALAYVGRAYWKTGTVVAADDVELTVRALGDD